MGLWKVRFQFRLKFGWSLQREYIYCKNLSVNGYYNVVVKQVCMSYNSLRKSYSYDSGLENESYIESDCDGKKCTKDFGEEIEKFVVNWSCNFNLRSCDYLRSFGNWRS